MEIAFQTPQKQMSFSRELRLVLQERNLLSAKSRQKVCSMLNGSIVSNSTPIGSTDAQPNSDRNRLKDFRCQAVKEIIDTEKAYLGQLELLMKYFVLPLKEQRLIETASHTLLFGQIEMIHSLNGEFLRTLEADMDNVAQAFLKMAPFFKLYSVYAFDYRNALLVLQDLTSKNPSFRKFLEHAESRPDVQRKLISLMIVPIQRVPRYKLLLQQVLYYTSPADPDFKVLRESIKEIESTVSHINSCVEDQETTQILINLQNSLNNRTPNIIKPSRKVIKEGVLQKVTRNGTEIKRYCVLMSDIFMYCKILKDRASNTHVENSLECCCIFPLNKCKVYEHLPGNFKLTCQGDGIIFSTKDLQLQRTWVNFIRDAIELHLQCRKTLRKESSKRTPLRRKAVKNFGTDYVLSPSKRKGEYDTIFRNENRSSDSEDSDSITCKRVGCLGFTKSNGHNESKWLKNRRKRRAPSPSQAPWTQRFNCSSTATSIDCGSSSSKRQPKLFNYTGQNRFQRHGQTGILKPNSAAGLSSNSNSEYDSSYGFATRPSNAKTYRCGHNVDSTMPVLKSEALSQNADLHVGRKALEEIDETALSPPLKKRVKFDDAYNTITECVDSAAANVPKQQIFKPFGMETALAEDEAPLYQKIWNFFAKLF